MRYTRLAARPFRAALLLAVALATAIGFGLVGSPAQAASGGAGIGTVAAVPTAAGPVFEVNAAFTAQQGAQLRQYLSSPAGRARVSANLGPVTASGRPGSGITPFAQGGRDGDHWWIKISAADIFSVGIGVACRAAFPVVGWFVCPPISAVVRAAISANPNAGGVWAELYDSGRVRAGTW